MVAPVGERRLGSGRSLKVDRSSIRFFHEVPMVGRRSPREPVLTSVNPIQEGNEIVGEADRYQETFVFCVGKRGDSSGFAA
jgi:hypothetical protein